jgi:hypothetical protein
MPVVTAYFARSSMDFNLALATLVLTNLAYWVTFGLSLLSQDSQITLYE